MPTFSTRLESADRGLHFDAVFRYNRQLTGVGVCIHPDAVARTIIRDLATPIARRFAVGQACDAESAVNAALSSELTLDPRLRLSASAQLTCNDEVAAMAERRSRAAEPILAEDAARTLRLELLRACLLNHGPAYWLDQDARAGHITESPVERTRSLLEAQALLRDTLQEEGIRDISDGESRLRARFEDLLCTLRDPVIGERLLTLLESLRETIDPASPTVPGASTVR